MTLACAGLTLGKTLLDEKNEKRRNHKEDDRVAGEPIGELLPARGFQIFLHGQGPDVACAAAIQITRSGMVQSVFPSPMMVWHEGEHPGDVPPEVVGGPGFEKGAMTAIVANDEQTNHESSCQNRQRHGQPP